MHVLGSVGLALRAEWRGGWRSWVAIALLIGVVGGLVLAATTAGRRTASAFPQFVAAHGFDAELYATQPEPEVAKLADVTSVTVLAGPDNGAPSCDCTHPISPTDFGVTAVPDRGTSPFKLVSGRLPNPSAADEVLAGYTLQQDGVHLGSVIRVPFYAPSQAAAYNEATGVPPKPTGPRVMFHVVGFEVSEFEFPSGTTPTYTLYASRAFARTVLPHIAGGDLYLVRLRRRGGGSAPIRRGGQPPAGRGRLRRASASSPRRSKRRSTPRPSAGGSSRLSPRSSASWSSARARSSGDRRERGVPHHGGHRHGPPTAVHARGRPEPDRRRRRRRRRVGDRHGALPDRAARRRRGLPRSRPVSRSTRSSFPSVRSRPSCSSSRSASGPAARAAAADRASAIAPVAVAPVGGGRPSRLGRGATERGDRGAQCARAKERWIDGSARERPSRHGGGRDGAVRHGGLRRGTFPSHGDAGALRRAVPDQLHRSERRPATGRRADRPRARPCGDRDHARNRDRDNDQRSGGRRDRRYCDTRTTPVVEGLRTAPEQGDGEIGLGATTMRQVGAHLGSVVQVTIPLPSGGRRTVPFTVVGEISFPVLGGVVGLGNGAAFTIGGYEAAACPAGPGQSSCRHQLQQSAGGSGSPGQLRDRDERVEGDRPLSQHRSVDRRAGDHADVTRQLRGGSRLPVAVRGDVGRVRRGHPRPPPRRERHSPAT